jgi:hypothetical protein
MQAPSAPSAGDKLELATVNGALVHITVQELISDIDTVHGKADAIKCDIGIVDGGRKGETLEDVLIFPKVLVGQLRNAVGATDNVVVGRVGQGVAKPGKSAPWVLNTPSEADIELAGKYEQYRAKQVAERAQLDAQAEEPF